MVLQICSCLRTTYILCFQKIINNWIFDGINLHDGRFCLLIRLYTRSVATKHKEFIWAFKRLRFEAGGEFLVGFNFRLSLKTMTWQANSLEIQFTRGLRGFRLPWLTIASAADGNHVLCREIRDRFQVKGAAGNGSLAEQLSAKSSCMYLKRILCSLMRFCVSLLAPPSWVFPLITTAQKQKLDFNSRPGIGRPGHVTPQDNRMQTNLEKESIRRRRLARPGHCCCWHAKLAGRRRSLLVVRRCTHHILTFSTAAQRETQSMGDSFCGYSERKIITKLKLSSTNFWGMRCLFALGHGFAIVFHVCICQYNLRSPTTTRNNGIPSRHLTY